MPSSKYELQERSFRLEACERCGSTSALVVHHKDGNHYNGVPENRETLCRSCHVKEHRPRTGTGEYKPRQPASKHSCLDCDALVKRESLRCRSCARKLVMASVPPEIRQDRARYAQSWRYV